MGAAETDFRRANPYWTQALRKSLKAADSVSLKSSNNRKGEDAKNSRPRQSAVTVGKRGARPEKELRGECHFCTNDESKEALEARTQDENLRQARHVTDLNNGKEPEVLVNEHGGPVCTAAPIWFTGWVPDDLLHLRVCARKDRTEIRALALRKLHDLWQPILGLSSEATRNWLRQYLFETVTGQGNTNRPGHGEPEDDKKEIQVPEAEQYGGKPERKRAGHSGCKTHTALLWTGVWHTHTETTMNLALKTATKAAAAEGRQPIQTNETKLATAIITTKMMAKLLNT